MTPLISLRLGTRLALGSAAALMLAACGSAAVNTTGVDESLSPYPSATAMNSPSGSPTAHHTAGASPTAHATSSATHRAMTMPSTTPQARASTPPRNPVGHTTGSHTVAPTAAVITVTPSTNLAEGQTVTVRGARFKPGVSIIIVECVNHGANTQNTNCTGNGGLFGIPPGFTPSANGTFTKTFVVHKSFSGIGGGYNTCSSSSPCIISVTEASQNPSEEADAPIRFS